jgi:hypothetical protein
MKLRKTVRTASISPYYPGAEIFIPKEGVRDAVKVSFPPNVGARVPKGFIARLHLLVLLERAEQSGLDPANVIFACIDGSGAFDFDSLQLLIEPFVEDANIDVVFGRRPDGNPGMPMARKVVEEFEQYLLFRHRPKELKKAFPDCDLEKGILPDGQAGCWAFRLKVGTRLQLAASGYEIEFDLLASVLELGLKACYSKPLLMPMKDRTSLASLTAVPMSIKKLGFIERKLGISRSEIAEGWSAFATLARNWPDSELLRETFVREFAKPTPQGAILPAYQKALMKHCAVKTSVRKEHEKASLLPTPTVR